MSFKYTFSFLLMTFFIFSLISCAAVEKKIYHGWIMKGSIVDVSDSEVYLCIGSKDGASAGQELNVYRVISRPVLKGRGFERHLIGRVKIVEVTDEHFAKARVVSGTAEKNDIVELER